MFSEFGAGAYPGSYRGGGGLGMGGGLLRGRTQGGAGPFFQYPHPFFDLASTYLPPSMRQLLGWCRYFFYTQPLIHTVTFKMAEYPITDVICDHPSPQVAEGWLAYLQDHLQIRSFQLETGLDFWCYGNTFVSIIYPLVKYLRCSCGHTEAALRCRERWQYTGQGFRYDCPKCGDRTLATPIDTYPKSPYQIRLHRWNPEDIDIGCNELTGEHTYFYRVPLPLKNDILAGRKEVVGSTPNIFLQGVREEKAIIFSPDNLFHMKRPSLAGKDRGWGLPLCMPVLKNAFHLQLLRKANEAICTEHIVPMRAVYPQPATGSSDPFALVNLSQWREQIGMEIARWRADPNYVPISPIPIGQQTLGGDGRALMITPEIQNEQEQILAGMGVPRELVFGGASWSGSNVSLRMVENLFLSYILTHKRLLAWITSRIGAFLDWPRVKTRMAPFKMADDLQRKAFTLQLSSLGKISDTTLLNDSGFEQDKENALILSETPHRMEAMRKQQLAMADIQGEVGVATAKWQAKAMQVQQEAMAAAPAQGEPGAAPQLPGSPINAQQQPGADLGMVAQQQAMQLAQLPPEGQQLALQNLAAQSPDLAQLVEQQLAGMGPPTGGAGGVDARPMPEQRPPRRQT